MCLYIVVFVLFAAYPEYTVYGTTVCPDLSEDGMTIPQWPCQDKARTCIPHYNKCNGAVNCPDGSDESHAVCRNKRCAHYLFRCTYGACVDGDAERNGTQECADGSDELQSGDQKRPINGIFRCANGDVIPSEDHCDGVRHCADGSDETLETCTGRRCAPNLFQCAYGACVDADAACDAYGKLHCADGSDEADALCKIKDNRPSTVCIVPDTPPYMSYTVIDHMSENAAAGQGFTNIFLNVTCFNQPNPRSSFASCKEGFWEMKTTTCPNDCKVPRNEGIRYFCNMFTEAPCREYEPSGALVNPKCIDGYYQEVPRLMKCVDGKWDHEVKCERATPSCGMPVGAQAMMLGGRSVRNGEVPWQAAIYDKSGGEPRQICGGSLVSPQLVISAAHCFWDDVARQQPHTRYAVALGQHERKWGAHSGQRFNVSSIKLHDDFAAETMSWAYDIALVFLDKPAIYGNNVQPVCLDLDSVEFNRKQLADGNLGKVAGWGLAEENGNPSNDLMASELPTVNLRKCRDESHYDFKRYIIEDKICAGNITGYGLCQGDSGGGLAFRDGVAGPYYLRGVASIRYPNGQACNNQGYTVFTSVFHYAEFIKKNNK